MKNRHPVSEAHPPDALLSFWRGVRELIAALWSSFGGPEEIAARGFLCRADHAWIGQALRGLEAALRLLLFVQAAKLTLPSVKKQSARFFAKPAVEEADLAKPETWRVRFRLAPLRSSASRRSQNPQQETVRAAWPFAARFEALLRVFDAPEVYVKRAARLIAKNKPRLTKPRGLPPWAGMSLIDDIVELAEDEAPAFNSS